MAELRLQMIELCNEKDINVTKVYIPRKQTYGLLCAIGGKKIVAITPFWKSDDGIWMIQPEITPVSNCYWQSTR